MFTLNTSSIAQAVIGGFLLEHECSLRAVHRESEIYRQNLRRVRSRRWIVISRVPAHWRR